MTDSAQRVAARWVERRGALMSHTEILAKITEEDLLEAAERSDWDEVTRILATIQGPRRVQQSIEHVTRLIDEVQSPQSYEGLPERLQIKPATARDVLDAVRLLIGRIAEKAQEESDKPYELRLLFRGRTEKGRYGAPFNAFRTQDSAVREAKRALKHDLAADRVVAVGVFRGRRLVERVDRD